MDKNIPIGSLVKLAGEVSVNGERCYLMDYDDLTTDLPFVGVVVDRNVDALTGGMNYDVLVNSEMVGVADGYLYMVEE